MFNTIVPTKLIPKLKDPGTKHLPLQLYPGLPDGRPQMVRASWHLNTSSTLILNTGFPQGCVLSSLLYSLFTHDSNTIIKFADYTMVVGLITDNNEIAYREEVRDLAVPGQQPLPQHEQDKGAYRGLQEGEQAEQAPINIDGAVVERVESSLVSTSPTNQESCEEGTTKPFPPQKTEKIWHGSLDPQTVLQLHQ